MPIIENSIHEPVSTPLNDLLTTMQVAALTSHLPTALLTFSNRCNNTKYKNAGSDYVKLGTAGFYERPVIETYITKRAGS